MDKNDVQFKTYIKTYLMFIIKKGGVKFQNIWGS